MNTTYTQKNYTVQKVANSNAESVKDSSIQNDSLQRKADMANGAAQRAADPRPNNTGLPDDLKTGIESLSGFSMDGVRVHYNSSRPASVQALAYTQGTDIHVAPGQEQHLPHEAWHVAQQMAGRVAPTTNINGMPVNDNAGLEHEADVMGERALQRKGEECVTSMNMGDCVENIAQLMTVVQCGNEVNAPKQWNHLFSSLPAFIDELTGRKDGSGYVYIQGLRDDLEALRNDDANKVRITEGADSNTKEWTSGMNACRYAAMSYYCRGHGFDLVNEFKKLSRCCVDENVSKRMKPRIANAAINRWNVICEQIAANLLKEMSEGNSYLLNDKVEKIEKKEG